MPRMSALEFGGSDGGYAEHFASNFDPHLNLTVIHTTPEGTLAALKTASDLARGLHARISLVMVQVVPFRLRLGTPMISMQFLRTREARLVAQSGLDENMVSIEICLCREPKIALRQCLPIGSLVVMGGKQRWWRSEPKLAKWLAAAGRQVLFVDVTHSKQSVSRILPHAVGPKTNKPVSIAPH
jgi:hypothetical protein